MGRSANAEGTRTGYAGWWADGIYFNVRLTDERACLLVLMGTLEDGTRERVSVSGASACTSLALEGHLEPKHRILGVPVHVAPPERAI